MNKIDGVCCPRSSTQNNGGRKKGKKGWKNMVGKIGEFEVIHIEEGTGKKLKSLEFHSLLWELEQFCHRWINSRWDSSYHQEDFPHHFMSTIPLKPAVLLQSRVQFLSHLLVPFIIMVLSIDRAGQHLASGFLGGFLLFSSTAHSLLYFQRHFEFLTGQPEYKREKGLKQPRKTSFFSINQREEDESEESPNSEQIYILWDCLSWSKF